MLKWPIIVSPGIGVQHFGNDIETIYTFDVNSKKNLSKISRLIIKPHDELTFNKNNLSTGPKTFLEHIQ